MSFVNSTAFTALLFFWLVPGYAAETAVFGWIHGCLWIALSVLSIIAVRLHEIPFWLAVVVAVVGGIGPYAARLDSWSRAVTGGLHRQGERPARLDEMASWHHDRGHDAQWGSR